MTRSTLLLVGAALVAFLLFWQAVVIVSGFPPFILPPPADVLGRLGTAWTAGIIQPHLTATLVAAVLGFAVGAGTALVLGYALARSALVARILSPYLVAAQAVPILVLAPLIALWFGPGLLGKVIICALIVFFPVAVATMVGIRAVDAGLLELGRSLRATRRQILTTPCPRSWGACVWVSRSPWSARSWGSGRGPSVVSASSSTSPAGRCSISRSCSPRS
jgi:ABC-type nitrate/sulfonate/bicarbonate transport system permease component